MLMETKQCSHPEIWGGIECTINRVGNVFRDQLDETGHYLRPGDIKAFAALGIKKMRYPILWERHSSNELDAIDWTITTVFLQELRNNHIEPIAGLLHHGSGPMGTNLLDDAFPEKLAFFAGQVAAQYPWIEYYTPVNEPLTTARFSGLYGFWYPHHSSERSFVQMLLNQVKGIVLSMQAIRKSNPNAKLIQTEDLCRIHSTPSLAYQAAFENERRWLTYDLLCGKFNEDHLLWRHFLSLGIPEKTLLFFVDNICVPDSMGFNYYITSERYLDDRLENYPNYPCGGNGRQYYVDVEAARTSKRSGLQLLLEEAWERYGVPLAITECHLKCSREEQMRWLKEIWDTCCLLNKKGIIVRAVTAWSLLGSFDWDSLLLQQNGNYESGVFDVSDGSLRPTRLAEMVYAYATGHSFEHPLLTIKGWWNTLDMRSRDLNDTAGLLLIGEDAAAMHIFDEICIERGIGCQMGTVRQLQQHSTGFLDRCSKQHELWGIMVLLKNGDDEYAVYEEINAFCCQKSISIVFCNTDIVADSAGNREVMGTAYLYIQNHYTDQIKFAHTAMDLFIDEAKGYWLINSKGALKIEDREVEMVN